MAEAGNAFALAAAGALRRNETARDLDADEAPASPTSPLAADPAARTPAVKIILADADVEHVDDDDETTTLPEIVRVLR